jgi:group II intron reverse transcriptase/maturase
VNLATVTNQNFPKGKPSVEGAGEARTVSRGGQTGGAVMETGLSGTSHLMEQVVARANVQQALDRVRKNQGSPGSDGMTVDELPEYLNAHWQVLRQQLLDGSYCPAPVRRKEIPKDDGEVRVLGIPTVLDRLIQQAILQVLQPRFDPTFSPHSHGFRPGRRAHDAVRAAQRYIQDGKTWVVDVDLEKFFDRVNHDVLMGRLAKRIADKRLLRIIRGYLTAGMMLNGVVMERDMGTPQGGPLSPLLANVLLDEIDKELERRGHTFARYADDCNVYVRTERAGQRVMASLTKLYGKLRLRINANKSAVARVTGRGFLGFSFWIDAGRVVRRRVAKPALGKLKRRVRKLTRRCVGRSLEQVAQGLRKYLPGWRAYYGIAETPKVFRELDGWIRHRLRAIQLKQWRRGITAFREMRKRGVSVRMSTSAAYRTRSWWRTANSQALRTALPVAVFDQMRVPRLAAV